MDVAKASPAKAPTSTPAKPHGSTGARPSSARPAGAGIAEEHVPNVGMHIANRLVELGCTHAFSVPGDFNLLLLDQLLKNPRLNMVWCCNELNAGYAADGYARKAGIGCCVVTFCVGGFSALNAIAGAYAEDLPIIVISGGPNSNDFAANHVLHHTTGHSDFNQQLRCFKEVTCCQVVIQHIDESHRLIDFAISEALKNRKPAYIEVCCNLADQTHPSFSQPPIPFMLASRHTNTMSLEAAVDAAVEVLGRSVKPVLLAGPRIRPGDTRMAFKKLADASQYAVAALPDAKGMFPEDHPHYMGLYWGAVSWPCVCEIVESADIVITAGAVWTDYTTVGYSLLLKQDKVIRVEDGRVTICNGLTFGCIRMEHFLEALAARLAETPNPTSWSHFKRMALPQAVAAPLGKDEPLTVINLFKHVQAFLQPGHAVLSEVGDSWFNTQKLRLPAGCEYELQLRYGSIGWSVGALLGYACASQPYGDNQALATDDAARQSLKASKPPPAAPAAGSRGATGEPAPAEAAADAPNVIAGALAGAQHARSDSNSDYNGVRHTGSGDAKRVVAFIGDGSFQMTCQEISTLIRYGLNPIIFLINNGGYTIEVEIHDGPYNVIKNWDYTAFVKSLHNGQGRLWTTKVRTEPELEAAIEGAKAHPDCLCFIEVFVHKDDCSKELLEWGSRVATANGRPARPQ